MAEPIDWSKAGKRLRRTPYSPAHGGRNPDWNHPEKRWKNEAEYAADEMTIAEVVDRVDCPYPDCLAPKGQPCIDVRGAPMPDCPHGQRRAAAGADRVAAGEFKL